MHTRFLAFLALGSAGLLAADFGCASNSSSNNGSTGTASGATSGAGGGAGGHGGASASASSSSAATTTASGSGGGGGSNPCEGSIDTPCEQCAATKCHDQAKACAETSTCTADGTPTGGCLALVSCAAMKCTKMGMLDQTCVFANCSSELASSGGFQGKGTAAAIALGQCLNQYCMTQCTN